MNIQHFHWWIFNTIFNEKFVFQVAILFSFVSSHPHLLQRFIIFIIIIIIIIIIIYSFTDIILTTFIISNLQIFIFLCPLFDVLLTRGKM